MITVIIPWRAQPSRLAAFEAVTQWYARELGGVEFRTVDSGDEPFNLARCRNLGIAEVADRDSVVIINDADTIPQLEPLLAAIEGAASSGLVHLPYTVYRWLGAEGTAQFERGTPLANCEFTLIKGACSGVYVTTPRTWEAHGGQDERFRGWGFEDSAWLAAHTTLLGSEPRREVGDVYALTHDLQERSGPQYELNASLMQKYRDAESDAQAMRRLVFDRSA